MAETLEPLVEPKDKLILIADDDDHVRGFLETFLRNEGFQVALAKDGAEALAKAGERRPHLVITDLRMPGEGGYEVLRKLQGEATNRIPVIVVTATRLDASTVEMIEREANVVAFIHKPIEIPNLLTTVHQVLRTSPPDKKCRPARD